MHSVKKPVEEQVEEDIQYDKERMRFLSLETLHVMLLCNKMYLKFSTNLKKKKHITKDNSNSPKISNSC